MSGPIRHLAVFCGSSSGRDPAHVRTARALGSLLADRGIALVYGGGRVGLMGELADAVLAGGGSVTGVITRQLLGKEVGHDEVQELLVVDSMHERKLAMADRADGFVALPGGFGTLEELFEAVTWTQLGIHAKPVGLLDPTGFFGPLLIFVDSVVDEGFIGRRNRSILVADADATQLLDRMTAWNAPDTPASLDADQR